MAALAPPKHAVRKQRTTGASEPFSKSSPSMTRSQFLKDRTGGMRGNNNNNNKNNNNDNNNNSNYLNSSNNNSGNNNGNNINSNNNNNNNNNNNESNRKSNFHTSRLNFNHNDDGPPHSDAFPERYTICGMLDVRTNKKRAWKRRYFVLSNNFLLCGATSFAQKLERVTPLEGCTVTKYPAPTNPNGNGKTNGKTTKKTEERKSEDENKSDMRDTSSSSTSTSSSTKNSKNNNDNNGYNSDPRNRFELKLRSGKVLYFRSGNIEQCDKWSNAMQRASSLKIKDIYRFLYTLGTSESQMTKVVSAKHKETNEDCAIKIVDKRTCDSKMLQSEIKILKKLDNDYIVQLYDLFETKKFLYIVMEKCEGGELFDQIADLDGDHYTENDCCRVMYQIAHGVKYMHTQGIVHRDLKPENILCVEPKSIRKVKIADFGISKMVKNPENLDTTQFETMAGTLSYTAPEILRGKGYTKAVDCWSIGVIMYILLCGYAPFWGESDNELSYEILKRKVDFEEPDWSHVSKESIALVSGLLDKNPKTRLTLDDIIKLTWQKTSLKLPSATFRNKFRKFVTKRKNIKQRYFSSGYAESSAAQTRKQAPNFGVMQLTLPPK